MMVQPDPRKEHEEYYGLDSEDYYNYEGSSYLEKIHNWLKSHKTTFCKVCKVNLGRSIED